VDPKFTGRFMKITFSRSGSGGQRLGSSRSAAMVSGRRCLQELNAYLEWKTCHCPRWFFSPAAISQDLSARTGQTGGHLSGGAERSRFAPSPPRPARRPGSLGKSFELQISGHNNRFVDRSAQSNCTRARAGLGLNALGPDRVHTPKIPRPCSSRR